MIEEVRSVLPELLRLNAQASDGVSLTFRAEERLDLSIA